MPYIHIDIDLVEFDDNELVDELKSRGYDVVEKCGSVESLGNLDHIEHLVVCGQIVHARAEALLLVGRAIGRPL